MAGNHQHIAGYVSKDGTLISGEGASVEKVSKGEYKVTFDTAFADLPAVVATLHNADKNLSVHAVITYEITTSYACIMTGNADSPPAGVPDDSSFSFIAFGDKAS